MEKLLVGIHGGMAMLSGRVEWMLDTDAKIFDGLSEAEFLSRSIKDVADHYGGGMFDQKTLDWMNLTQCLLIVYGGRIFAIRANPKTKVVAAPSVQQTAQTHRAAPPASVHRTPPPVNEFAPNRNGHEQTPPSSGYVAGIGEIEFPDSHPLKPH